jgi:DNA topoisomerase VI subunit A
VLTAVGRYNIPEDCRLDMTPADLKTARELLKEDFIQKNPKWVKELELMETRKKKAEIRAWPAGSWVQGGLTVLGQRRSATTASSF